MPGPKPERRRPGPGAALRDGCFGLFGHRPTPAPRDTRARPPIARSAPLTEGAPTTSPSHELTVTRAKGAPPPSRPVPRARPPSLSVGSPSPRAMKGAALAGRSRVPKAPRQRLALDRTGRVDHGAKEAAAMRRTGPVQRQARAFLTTNYAPAARLGRERPSRREVLCLRGHPTRVSTVGGRQPRREPCFRRKPPFHPVNKV